MLLPEDAFAEHERWAWNLRLCLGQIADMSDYRGGDGKECNIRRVAALLCGGIFGIWFVWLQFA